MEHVGAVTDQGIPTVVHETADGSSVDAAALRETMTNAAGLLGGALLSHPENHQLRRSLADGLVTPDRFTRQLICVVYRVLILRVASQRGLVAHQGTTDTDPEGLGVCLTLERLDPVLGSYLWSEEATPDIGPHTVISDDAWSSALAPLLRLDAGTIEPETLGSVYESLLAFRVTWDAEHGAARVDTGGANSRRSVGSYYTPRPLVESLLDTTLEPLIDERLGDASRHAERDGVDMIGAQRDALRRITVCDPAVGSGRFLIAAARRLSRRVAALSHQEDPDHDTQPAALRDVIRNCLYGVDIDPLAVALCRMTLWFEMSKPGLPMTFLDAHIKTGNALLGATPEMIAQGIPDEAFMIGTRTDGRAARALKKRNRAEHGMSAGSDSAWRPDNATHERLIADAWCAAFVWPRGVASGSTDPAWAHGAITQRVFHALQNDPASVPCVITNTVAQLACEHGFFHWHLEFPEIFGDSGTPEPRRGFDVVVGNPPFLNQLEQRSASARGPAAIVRLRTHGAARGYADLSSAFLLVSTQIAASTARVALVLPQSFLSAGDVAGVRSAVLEHGTLTALWVSGEHMFDGASVYTCAPTLAMGSTHEGALTRSSGPGFERHTDLLVDRDALRSDDTWAPLMAAAFGVPEIGYSTSGSLADIADATADFRDQYYGLKGFLIEDVDVDHEAAETDARFPPILTSGLVELARHRWGTRGTRIHKARWAAPRVDRERVEREGELGPWIAARLVPKVVLATQTKIMEAYVDGEGRFVPSTPLITVTPKSGQDVWRIAAALAAPVCSVVAMRRYAGAALSAGTIKLSAKQALRLPLPLDHDAWNAGAALLREAHDAPGDDARGRLIVRFGRTMCEASAMDAGDTDRVMEWWCTRQGLDP